ncbi:HEAT repeat domain-containing protein [Kitasatospora sp. NPDC059571]|uniref:HEAT repeat domain-containing protein n=1 Tax=Kitasatospora sp. NPDC059571 TaxID=3346871 RepID=UPI0036C7827F
MDALLPYVPWSRAAPPRLRQSLAWFFGRADCEADLAVRSLTEFMSDPCSRTRGEAAVSLGMRGGVAASGLLRRALIHPDHGVRVRAVTALGRVGARDARDELQHLAGHDGEQCVRDAAAAALRALTAPAR